MGENDAPPSVLPISSSSPTLTHAPTLSEAVDDFLMHGYPHLEGVMAAIAASDAPEEIKTPFLRILGRYLHTLREARIDEGMSMEGAHTCASNAVMGDAKVAALIDRMMNQGVAEIVTRAVE